MEHPTEYTECQAFFPVVRIGSPHPLTPKGGGRHTRLRERRVGRPNSDEETDTLVLYTVIPLRYIHFHRWLMNVYSYLINDDLTVLFSFTATVISFMLFPYWLIFLENSSCKVQPESIFVTTPVLTQ
jgi:hypothetical protein